ncbi:MAG: nucleotidyltransferase family protein [Bacteroidetes bacterium]|nr:nucleotidyltransferase family protein [Bacteroidota bacterium]
MNAMILAAGLGSRLGTLTSSTPKPLLPIKGQPLLDILIKKLLKLKIEKIVINIYYKAGLIEDFLKSRSYYENLIISREEKLLGTAGSLKLNLKHLSQGNFIVMHGDNYFNDDLSSMVEYHKSDSTRSLLTIGTFHTDTPELYGVVDIDNENFVKNFYEKNTNAMSKLANSAIYIFKKESSETINELTAEEIDISKHLIPKFIDRMRAYPLNGFFYDIGSPERYHLAKHI